jgi:hypothetical protein
LEAGTGLDSSSLLTRKNNLLASSSSSFVDPLSGQA